MTVAWCWLRLGSAAEDAAQGGGRFSEDFYRGKLAGMRYFYEYELPKTLGLAVRLKSERRVTLETEAGVLA